MPAEAIVPPGGGLRIRRLETVDGEVRIEAVCTAPCTRCPACGQSSSRVHSHYQRTLRDLPWVGLPVTVHLTVRRFRCTVPSCPRSVFTERLPELAEAYAHVTSRRVKLETVLALGVGGEPGKRLMQHLGLAVSADTLLRRARSAPDPGLPRPTAIGVDDWAWRRGQRYGTIVIDLSSHRVLDLLPDREVATVARWLSQHPGITVISRDRSNAYAQAGRLGAPGARQVCDRFHLVKNLGEAVERAVHRVYGQIRPALEGFANADRPVPAAPPPRVRRPTKAENARGETQARRQARYDAIHAYIAQGMSLRTIARTLGLERKTVRKYAIASQCPSPKWRRRVNELDPFRAYLAERWGEGVHNASILYEEVRAQGFRGSRSAVRAYVRPWRTVEGRAPTVTRRIPVPPAGPKRVAITLGKNAESFTQEERRLVHCVEAASPELAQIRSLALEFRNLLRDRKPTQLSEWIHRVAVGQVRELRTFALSLLHDEDSVLAAAALPWSNGPTEGAVNRLKAIKRSMYGRGNVDLLRKRAMAQL